MYTPVFTETVSARQLFNPMKAHMNRYQGLLARILLALMLAAAAMPGLAVAQEAPPRSELSAETLIETARAALAKGELEDAEFLLRGVKPEEGNIDDLDFLHGSIAMAREDWQTAITRFRAMLIRDPTLPRVRLDLALSYFRAGEDSSAAYHFRQVLGDEDLPPIVRARTLAFLDTIRRRKTWSVDAAVGIAPDSNINAATSSRQVTLFGLPAQLSEDARQTSGVGLNVNISAGYEARISPDLRFRTGASLSTRTYEQSKFNDRTLTLRAGPRFLFERFDLRPELTARARHLGGEIYSRAAGIELSGNWHVAPAWRLSGAVSGERIFYETFLGNGNMYSTRVGLAHALGRATLLQADGAFRRESVDSKAYSWREFIVGASATRELPRGFVVTAGSTYRLRRYDRPIAAFGPEARQDRTLAGRMKVSNRHIELFGFMPELTLSHERRRSNLSLYDFKRNLVEVGVVRRF